VVIPPPLPEHLLPWSLSPRRRKNISIVNELSCFLPCANPFSPGFSPPRVSAAVKRSRRSSFYHWLLVNFPSLARMRVLFVCYKESEMPGSTRPSGPRPCALDLFSMEAPPGWTLDTNRGRFLSLCNHLPPSKSLYNQLSSDFFFLMSPTFPSVTPPPLVNRVLLQR